MEISGARTFPLRAAYAFAAQNQLGDDATAIKELKIEWERPYTSSVRRGFMIKLFEDKNLLNNFKSQHWEFGNTKEGKSECRRLTKLKLEFQAFCESKENCDDKVDSYEFAMEAHLRDFLAKDPERIEAGLKLFATDDCEGVEYQIDNGRIDLLCIDKNENFVVIELKLSKGRNKALGQLMYYMGWVDQHLGRQPCRGIIIANYISNELVTATSRAPNVYLFRYSMNFFLEKI